MPTQYDFTPYPNIKVLFDETKHGGPPQTGGKRTGDYSVNTLDDLFRIQHTDVGNRMLHSLHGTGKTVTICMMAQSSMLDMARSAGISRNQTTASSEKDGVNKIISSHLNGDLPGMRGAIKQALKKATEKGCPPERFRIAGVLVKDLNYEDLQAVGDGKKDWPKESNLYLVEAALALEAFADRGTGTDSIIKYDPWDADVKPGIRPSDVGLFHELVHAWFYAKGSYPVWETQESKLREVYEKVVIGCDDYGKVIANTGKPRRFTENLYRVVRGLADRTAV